MNHDNDIWLSKPSSRDISRKWTPIDDDVFQMPHENSNNFEMMTVEENHFEELNPEINISDEINHSDSDNDDNSFDEKTEMGK